MGKNMTIKDKPPKKDLKKLYIFDKKTIVEIAEIFGYSRTTIHTWLKKYGIRIKSQYEALGIEYKPNKKELEKLYIFDEKNTVELGKIFKCAYQTISKWLDEYEIPKRNISQARGVKYKPSKKELEELYITNKKGLGEIAKFYGYSTGLIHRWLKEYNIQIRTPHESHIGMYCGKPTISKPIEYCYKYNPECKQSCHEKWFYTCVLCGHIRKDGFRQHATHHIDYNKQSGCDETQLRIIELCQSCHAKTNGSDGNRGKYQNTLLHLYILREWIDDVGFCKFDYRSININGTLDQQKGD